MDQKKSELNKYGYFCYYSSCSGTANGIRSKELLTGRLGRRGYAFKDSDIIYLSRGPIQSITSVKYVDTLGDEITITNDKYNTDLISEPGRIISTAGWYATKDTVNAVVVRYVVGYSSASDVPAAIKQAMLLLIGEMYEKRIDSVKRLPTAAEYLMNPYRVFTYY